MMKVYRGYNKDYPNWGIRPEQKYIWTTDDIDYAFEYTKEFENGGLVEFIIDDDKMSIADDFECERLFGDDWWDFGGLIDADNEIVQTLLDNGYNSAYLDNSGIDCYLIFDKKLIKSARDIDLNTIGIEKEIDEVLRLAGVQLDESVFWKGEKINNYEDGYYDEDSDYDPEDEMIVWKNPSAEWVKQQIDNDQYFRFVYDSTKDIIYMWYGDMGFHMNTMDVTGADGDIIGTLYDGTIGYWGDDEEDISNANKLFYNKRKQWIDIIEPNGYEVDIQY